MEDDFYWFWLCNISGIGCMKIKAIIGSLNDAKTAYNASESALYNIKGLHHRDIDRIIKSKDDVYIYDAFVKMCHTDIQFVHIKSDKYPSKLKELKQKHRLLLLVLEIVPNMEEVWQPCWVNILHIWVYKLSAVWQQELIRQGIKAVLRQMDIPVLCWDAV